jgi:hypothetical protein
VNFTLILTMALNLIMTVVQSVIKNPTSKAAEKGVLLHAYQSCNALSAEIKSLYPGDPDFA